jgi:curli biogenesis system outer membrane secretion channel CsgG
VQQIFAAVLLFCLLAVGSAGAAEQEIIRLGVMTFVSKADGVSSTQVGAITDVVTRHLTGSRTISVVEREQLSTIGREHRLNMSGLVDTNMAVEIGKLAGLQYMLLGSVTAFRNETSESLSSSYDSWTRKVRVTLDARVVDVATGEVVLTMAESSENKKTNSRHKDKYGVRGSSGYPSTGEVSTGAIEAADSRLSSRLRNELGEQPYVIAQNGGKVHISLGVNQGVRSGRQYLVYADGAEIRDPVDGTVIDRGKIPLAIVKISKPQGDFSVCDIVEERDEPGAIQPRHKLVSLSDSDARRMQRDWQKAKKNRKPAKSETWVQTVGDPSDSAMPLPKSLENAQSIPTPQSAPDPKEPERQAPLQSSRPLENQSTDPAKVIATYPLSSGEANIRRVAHLNARKLSGKKAYDKYAELAESYSGDYLAAYQAGRFAQQLKKNDDAKAWYDKALAINPAYKPAQDSRQKLK